MSSAPSLPRLAEKVLEVLRQDLEQLRPRQHLLSLASRLIPRQVGSDWRARILRWRGVQVGTGTLVFDTPSFTGGESFGMRNLTVGSHCLIDVGCSFELGAPITLGDRVTLGHEVMIITTTHELGSREHRAGALIRHAVNVEDGAWIGPRCLILPGVTIGAGAIVEPGSVVNKNVPPNTRVRGIPSRQVEELAP